MNCVVLDSEYINQAPDHILIVCDQPDFPSSKALVQYLQMVYPNAIMTSVDSINKALKIIHGYVTVTRTAQTRLSAGAFAEYRLLYLEK